MDKPFDPALLERPLVQIRDAAKIFGVSLNTVSRWIKIGNIEKVEGTQFIPTAEIKKFYVERSKPKTPEQRRRGRYKVGRHD